MSYRKIILILCMGIFLSAERNANAQTIAFNYLGSVQTWTVPSCVNQVTITAIGGGGGGNSGFATLGGHGATIVGLVNVTGGHVLNIYTGGAGSENFGSDGGAGGGGTFIYDVTSSTLLEAAGGGGGAEWIGSNGADASVTTTPTGPNGGSGELGGGTGGAYDAGGGGAGFLGDGSTEGSCQAGTGGSDFANGFAGGAGDACFDAGVSGGFGGGGGAGYDDGGGGGGYNGGGSGANIGGGGGGSYVNGTLLSSALVNTGDGSVTIVYLNDTLASATGTVVSSVSCNGGSNGEAAGTIVGAMPSTFTYSWAPSGGSTDTAKNLTAGIYTLTVNDACGHSLTSVVTITQPAIFSLSAVSTYNVSCNGANNGIATAVVTGATPFTYQWSDLNLQATQSATGLSAGTYTVAVFDACGASATAATTITQPNTLTVSASATSNVNCNGENNGIATANVSGGSVPYTYMWSDANSQATPSANGLGIGTYTVNVTDNNGCSGSARVTITQPNVLTVSASQTTSIACHGNATGGASSTVSGGTGPYTYAWTAGGGNGANSSTLLAGIDTIMVVDAHGCSVSASIVVTQPEALNILRNSTIDHGLCTAAAWVVVGGGAAPYTYAWSNNANITYFNSGLCKGNYCCTVTDHNGCADSVCMTVNSDLGVGNISGNGETITVYPNPSNGQFTIESSGVNGASSVEIYNVLGEKVYSTSIAANKGGATTVNISNQPNGIYLYRVISNDNGSLIGQGKVILQK